MELRRQVFDEKGEGRINRLGIDKVVVVKHEDRRLRQRGDVVE